MDSKKIFFEALKAGKKTKLHITSAQVGMLLQEKWLCHNENVSLSTVFETLIVNALSMTSFGR